MVALICEHNKNNILGWRGESRVVDMLFLPRSGTMLNMVGLILLGCSNTHDFNGLPAGAVILGLAGITFHLSQLHISNLYPRSRGFISSLLVAGFTGCGAIFYFLDLIFVASGGSRSALTSARWSQADSFVCST